MVEYVLVTVSGLVGDSMKKSALCLAALLMLMMSPVRSDQPSDFLYVWAWDKDGRDGDFLAVVDVAEGSSTYGTIVNSVSTSVPGFAHHTEHQMTDSTDLFVNSWLADPVRPRIATSFADVRGFAFPHSFERLANGNVLATFQRNARHPDEPGGVVELNRNGNFVQDTSAVNDVDRN